MKCVVKVEFPTSTKRYAYYYDQPQDVHVGDTIMVDSPYSGKIELEVKEIHSSTSASVEWLENNRVRLKHILKFVSARKSRWSYSSAQIRPRLSGNEAHQIILDDPFEQHRQEVTMDMKELQDKSGQEIMRVAEEKVSAALNEELYRFLTKCIAAKKQREKWIKHRQSQLLRINSLMQEAVKTFDECNFDEIFAAGMFKQLIQIEEERNQ